MSSFLKTSFIHDETAPSESLVLLLKRSFSQQHHLHFFLVFSIPRLSPCIVCFALGLHQRQTGAAGNVSIYKLLITVGWRTLWTRFSDHRFSEKVQLSRHRGPHRTKKKFSHAICLCLVRVRKVPVHCTCNSKSTVMFSCTLGLALGRRATAPARSGPRARWAGGATPGPAHAPGRFAKAGQARLRRLWSISAAIRGLSSDRAGRLHSIRTSKVSSKSIFLFCGKCAICDFPSETSATPSPRFEMRYI